MHCPNSANSLHARMRELADIQARQHGAAQAQVAIPKLYFATLLDIHQVAQFCEGIGQARDSRISAGRTLEPDPDAEHASPWRKQASTSSPRPKALTKWRSPLAARRYPEIFGFLFGVIDNPRSASAYFAPFQN